MTAGAIKATSTSTLIEQKKSLKKNGMREKKMKIVTVGGSHPRHLYYLNEIAKDHKIEASIIQVREHMLPEPPKGLDERYTDLWERHFWERDRSEMRYYGEQDYPQHEVLEVGKDELEGERSCELVQDIQPDIVLIFGCGLIRGALADVLPEMSLNLHLGISPRYRGAATLFWPFYFLEPQWAGCTIHKIEYEPDAGDILHQCSPMLFRNDGVHDVACRAVVQATSDMREILSKYPDWTFRKQTSTGKNFLWSDFKPQHLSMLYEVYDNDIAGQWLAGNIKGKAPELWSQL